MTERVLDDREWRTVPEVAAFLSVGRSAAYEAVRRGQIPSRRVGRNLRVPTAALRRWLAGLDPDVEDEAVPAA